MKLTKAQENHAGKIMTCNR